MAKRPAPDEAPEGEGEAGGEGRELAPGEKEELAGLFGLRAGAKVLVVGDGNLSFAGALSALETAAELTATTFEGAEEHCLRFPQSKEVDARLRASGVRVAHGVDATDLAGSLPDGYQGPFDRIVFQFPQHPERRKIQRQRELLRAFFRSAAPLLPPESGEVLVSLCKGQGGTAAEREEKKATDTWQVQDAAAEAGFILKEVVPCPIEKLAVLGYRSTGQRGAGLRESNCQKFQDKGFNLEGSLSHIFCRQGGGRRAALPLRLSQDVSFWIGGAFEEAELARALREAVGEGAAVEVTLLDEYESPEGKRARTYRLAAEVWQRALSRAAWRAICEEVRRRMARLGAEARGA